MLSPVEDPKSEGRGRCHSDPSVSSTADPNAQPPDSARPSTTGLLRSEKKVVSSAAEGHGVYAQFPGGLPYMEGL